MSEAEEIAKAVQGVAKFGEKSLETSKKIGGFFARVFKEPIQELFQLFCVDRTVSRLLLCVNGIAQAGGR